jgi:biotin synthase
MTDGCPDREGKLACNRPYGSYRPGEAFRDYPFFPEPSDIETIRGEMRLVQIEA